MRRKLAIAIAIASLALVGASFAAQSENTGAIGAVATPGHLLSSLRDRCPNLAVMVERQVLEDMGEYFEAIAEVPKDSDPTTRLTISFAEIAARCF